MIHYVVIIARLVPPDKGFPDVSKNDFINVKPT